MPTTPSRTSPARTPPAGPAPGTTYYFAFGSNMNLTQMATRCPNSRLFAKGTLPDFRWQINERGVANVVPASYAAKCSVQGILFTVTPRDIASLDRSEGIKRQFYDKTLLHVRVEPFAVDGVANKKTVAVDLRRGEQTQTERQTGRRNSNGLVKEVEALVYLSGRYREDGRIRDEYVARMQAAIADARILGVDEAYLRTSLEPLVLVDAGRPGLSSPQRRIIERRPAQEE